jgi:hypothetical protein
METLKWLIYLPMGTTSGLPMDVNMREASASPMG